MSRPRARIRIGSAPLVIGSPEPGSLSHRLARRLSLRSSRTRGAHARTSSLDCVPHIPYSVRMFDDGESKITLRGDVQRGSTAIVVQSTGPPVDTNLVRALALISAAHRRARRVIAVVPYMGYARQDRAFLAGEIVTMATVARLFASAGASAIAAVDMHSAEGLRHFDIPAVNIPAAPALAAHFARMRTKDVITVSPDAGAKDRATAFARDLGCDTLVLEKRRNRRTGRVKIMTRDATAARGRDVIIIDDMISTGSSIAKAAAFLKSHGCARIHAACTHALLVGNARSAMRRAGISSITSTNTVPGPTAKVDVSELIAQALAR